VSLVDSNEDEFASMVELSLSRLSSLQDVSVPSNKDKIMFWEHRSMKISIIS
jgi:hypothetical protein